MSSKTMTTAQLKAKLMKSPAFRKEYDALESDFAFAGQLLKARQEAGMTQAEVAAKMNTDQAVVARLEGGKKPSFATLERYAKAVGRQLRIALV
jgi:ribosome-binding protein aMBF1 (putative translation factor)